jgi:glutamate racemase
MINLSPDSHAPIGVFDSGIGGLSVLKALLKAMPHERFVYFADSTHAPYGEKDDAFVTQRACTIAAGLRLDHGIKALVVACNTATAAAISTLRNQHPDLIIIGIEPALKIAAAHSHSQQIGVLATRSTLASAKFQSLLAQQIPSARFTLLACDGLASAIENGLRGRLLGLNAPAIHALVQQYVGELLQANHSPLAIDTLVLGCTHYPLIRTVIEQYLPATVTIVDNGAAVAKQLLKRLSEVNLIEHLVYSNHPPQMRSSAHLSDSALSTYLAILK